MGEVFIDDEFAGSHYIVYTANHEGKIKEVKSYIFLADNIDVKQYCKEANDFSKGENKYAEKQDEVKYYYLDDVVVGVYTDKYISKMKEKTLQALISMCEEKCSEVIYVD